MEILLVLALMFFVIGLYALLIWKADNDKLEKFFENMGKHSDYYF